MSFFWAVFTYMVAPIIFVFIFMYFWHKFADYRTRNEDDSNYFTVKRGNLFKDWEDQETSKSLAMGSYYIIGFCLCLLIFAVFTMIKSSGIQSDFTTHRERISQFNENKDYEGYRDYMDERMSKYVK